MAEVIQIQKVVVDAMLAAARRDPNLECCGLLAGSAGVISAVLPAPNALASATSYEIAPEQLFALFRRMRAEQLDHLGIYHSHPRGDNAPSPRDVATAFYPDVAYFILGPRPDSPRPVRAFRIRSGAVRELVIDVL